MSTSSPTATRTRVAPMVPVLTSGSPRFFAFHHDPAAPQPTSAPTAMFPRPSVSAPCPWASTGGGEYVHDARIWLNPSSMTTIRGSTLIGLELPHDGECRVNDEAADV